MTYSLNKLKLKGLVIKIGSGATPSGGGSSYSKTGISLIRSQNVLDFVFSIDGLARINNDQANKLNNVIVESEDVLLNITGDSVARVCQVPNSILPARVNQHVAIIRTQKTKLYPGFLKYYLLSPIMKSNLLSLSSAGATRKALTKRMIEELEVEIPSLQYQITIAKILSSLDDKIELNLQMNKTLEAITQAIFKEWFVDFRFPGFDGALVDGLPKGWRKGKLKEIIKNFDSKRVPVSSQERAKRKGIYPYYGAASLMDYIDNYLFEGTFLLIGEDGSVIDDNGCPVLQYVWGKFWVNNHAHVIQGSNSFSTEYIYILLQRTQVSNIVTGAVQPKINQGNLNGIECVIPEDVRLKEFNNLVLPLFDRIKVNHDENILLTLVRDTLLPKLMSGEIKVE